MVPWLVLAQEYCPVLSGTACTACASRPVSWGRVYFRIGTLVRAGIGDLSRPGQRFAWSSRGNNKNNKNVPGNTRTTHTHRLKMIMRESNKMGDIPGTATGLMGTGSRHTAPPKPCGRACYWAPS
jgi:hypothetical protein